MVASAPLPLSARRVALHVFFLLIILLSVIVARPAVKQRVISWLRRPRARHQRRERGSSHPPSSPDDVGARVLGSSHRAFEDVFALPEAGLPIPSVVHYIFGLEPSFGHMKFGLIHYLSIVGARMHIAPQLIKWHYMYLPDGVWWECARPALLLHKLDPIIHIHGKPKAIPKVQHRADVLRMQIMMREGGMYIDSDVIPLRSFQELRKYECVMGKEEADGQAGLANAVILSAPNTSFINRWWEEYKTFEPEKQWAYHSVILPRQLLGQHPTEVTALSGNAFFAPPWTSLTAMYDKDDGYSYRENFAVHLWTSADANKQEMLRRLSIRDIFTGKGSFQRRARQLLVEALAQQQLCGHAASQVEYFVGAALPDIIRDWKPPGQADGRNISRG